MWENICPFSVQLASAVDMNKNDSVKTPPEVPTTETSDLCGEGSSDASKQQQMDPSEVKLLTPEKKGHECSIKKSRSIVAAASCSNDSRFSNIRLRRSAPCVLHDTVNCAKIHDKPSFSCPRPVGESINSTKSLETPPFLDALETKENQEPESISNDEPPCPSEAETVYQTPLCPSETGSNSDGLSSVVPDEEDCGIESDTQSTANSANGSLPMNSSSLFAYGNIFVKAFITLLPSVFVSLVCTELFAYAWKKF